MVIPLDTTLRARVARALRRTWCALVRFLSAPSPWER